MAAIPDPSPARQQPLSRLDASISALADAAGPLYAAIRREAIKWALAVAVSIGLLALATDVWTPLLDHYNHLVDRAFPGVDEHRLSAHQRVSAAAMGVPTVTALISTMAAIAAAAAAAATALLWLIKAVRARRPPRAPRPRAAYVFDVVLRAGFLWMAWQMTIFWILALALDPAELLRGVHAAGADDALTLRFVRLGAEQARLAAIVTAAGLSVTVISVTLAISELRPGGRRAANADEPSAAS